MPVVGEVWTPEDHPEHEDGEDGRGEGQAPVGDGLSHELQVALAGSQRVRGDLRAARNLAGSRPRRGRDR